MPAMLEHTNYTVSDPAATAAWMVDVFGWHVRWSGKSRSHGHSVHVGSDTHYLALYAEDTPKMRQEDNYKTIGGLNHIALVVDDIEAMQAKVAAAGFEVGEHYDYEPGQRFYFYDHDGIEYEIVQYDERQ